MEGQRTWKRWRRSVPFCLFCCARLPSGSAAPEAGCSLLCSYTQRRGRQTKGALRQDGHTEARWSRRDVSGSTRGVGQHHHVAAPWQLWWAWQSLWSEAFGGPVRVLECQKGDWEQPAWSHQQHLVPCETDYLLGPDRWATVRRQCWMLCILTLAKPLMWFPTVSW